MTGAVPTALAGIARFHWEDGLAWMVPGVGGLFPGLPPDSMDHPERSALRVWEDGRPLGPEHQPHAEIRSLGRGRCSHWGDYVLFSTADNSSPLSNGRRYELGTAERRVQLLPDIPADSAAGEALERRLAALRLRASEVDLWLRHERGHRWSLRLSGFCEHHGIAMPPPEGDVVVLEDGRPLDSCADAASVLAGDGRFARSGDTVFLSSRDGSNPKLNGRDYALRIDGRDWPVPPSVQALVLGAAPPVPTSLAGLVREAFRLGRDIPLATIWWTPEHPHPPRATNAYQYFLAGLARHVGARRILEIGTDRGASALALVAGLVSPKGRVVTVDLVDRTAGMPAPPQLTRIVGDATSPATVRQALELFGSDPIDILFVDSAHEYGATLAHLGVYQALLRPRLVVLDDILLNESMATLWADLRSRYSRQALNVCDVEPDARTPECGLGLLDLRAGPA